MAAVINLCRTVTDMIASMDRSDDIVILIITLIVELQDLEDLEPVNGMISDQVQTRSILDLAWRLYFDRRQVCAHELPSAG